MPAPSPSSLLDGLFDRVGQALQPPGWVVEELQRRLVLLLNHVLQQEPEAQSRLQRQTGRVVEAHWRIFSLRLIATPAGLLDLAAPSAPPDLTLTITQESPWALAQAALRGDRPPVRIAGDVQLAAEVQWLVDHVRWDLEEDLSRIVGDAPAHAMAEMGRRMAEALRRFVGGAAEAGAAATGAGSAAGATYAGSAGTTMPPPYAGAGSSAAAGTASGATGPMPFAGATSPTNSGMPAAGSAMQPGSAVPPGNSAMPSSGAMPAGSSATSSPGAMPPAGSAMPSASGPTPSSGATPSAAGPGPATGPMPPAGSAS